MRFAFSLTFSTGEEEGRTKLVERVVLRGVYTPNPGSDAERYVVDSGYMTRDATGRQAIDLAGHLCRGSSIDSILAITLARTALPKDDG